MSGWIALTVRMLPGVEDEVLLALHEGGTLGVHVLDAEEERARARRPGAGRGLTVPSRDGVALPLPAPAGGPALAGEGRGAAGAVRKRTPRDLAPPAGAVSGARETRVGVAYFRKGADLRSVVRRLEVLGESVLMGVSRVEDGAWMERQEAGRRPLAIGRRFVILPRAPGAHDPAGAATDVRIPLIVPPKRAFGTGEHETTCQCLELLEKLPIDGVDVLDLGTGSGILAMAAARLGARRVVAIDEDPEAIEIAAENLRLNHLLDEEGGLSRPAPAVGKGRVFLLIGRLDSVRGLFSVILANLYSGLLASLAEGLAARQEPGGSLILSGFAAHETNDLARTYAPLGYRESLRSAAGDWGALLLRKTA